MKPLQPLRTQLLGAVLISAGLLWISTGMSAQNQDTSHDNDAMPQDSGMTHDQNMASDRMGSDPGQDGTQNGPTYQDKVGHNDEVQSDNGMARDKSMPNQSSTSNDQPSP